LLAGAVPATVAEGVVFSIVIVIVNLHVVR
jgi:hypothetical protein